jgi:hypothetical protein
MIEMMYGIVKNFDDISHELSESSNSEFYWKDWRKP